VIETKRLSAERLAEIKESAWNLHYADEIFPHIAALDEEIAVARERLGPAGYKILQEVVQLRAENERLKNGVNKIIGMEPTLPIHPLIKKELKHLIQTVPESAE